MSNYIKKIIKQIKKKLKKPVKKSENPVKWGIMGSGYMAKTFSDAINGNRDGIVTAVASRTLDRAHKFASRYANCKAYGSYEELVNDADIDIIYIATPTECHFEHIKLCLEARKNVLCEKPLTTNADECESLIQLAREKDCLLMEGMWTKCLPTYKKGQEWLEAGKIGTLELIKVDFYKREIVDQTKATFGKNGGVLSDYGIYALAFVIGFLGQDIRIQSAFSRCSFLNIDSDWGIVLDSPVAKALINISSDFDSLSKAALIGTDGVIEWTSQFNRTNEILCYDKYGRKIDEYCIKYDYDGFEYEVDEAQKTVRKKRIESDVMGTDETLLTLRIRDQLMRQTLYTK